MAVGLKPDLRRRALFAGAHSASAAGAGLICNDPLYPLHQIRSGQKYHVAVFRQDADRCVQPRGKATDLWQREDGVVFAVEEGDPGRGVERLGRQGPREEAGGLRAAPAVAGGVDPAFETAADRVGDGAFFGGLPPAGPEV